MWKYIVTWFIMFFSPEPCPDNIPGCLVNHMKLDSLMKQKVVFYDRDSAFAVYNSLKKKNDKNNESAEDEWTKDKVKIDSVHISVIVWRNNKGFIHRAYDSVTYKYNK